MITDFRDASNRHFEDAELLASQARPHNADHLFGFAAECALKAVAFGLGHPQASNGDWPNNHHGHINVLWSRFQSHSNGLLDAKYVVHIPLTNPFELWRAEQRYWGRTTFSATNLATHRAAANDCCLLLKELILDGVFS